LFVYITSCSICNQDIIKEYAFAYFPHVNANVTLQRPGKSKKWHPKFYKRDESRKNMLMGRWLDFVRDNHVQEGDICLLLPTKDEIRYTFMIYVLRETTHSGGGAGFQRIGPCPGSSSAKMASEIHIEEEPTAGIVAKHKNTISSLDYSISYMVYNCLQENMFPRKVICKKFLMNLWRAETLMIHLFLHTLYHARVLYLNPRRESLRSECELSNLKSPFVWQ